MEFMSVENLKSLMNIIQTYFIDKQNTDPQLFTTMNLKKMFFEVMSKVHKENEKQSTTYKSKLTLKIIKEIVSIELGKSIPRDATVFADRQVVINENIDKKNNNLFENSDVKARMNDIATTLNNVPDNTIPTLQSLDSQLDDSLTLDDFQNKLASLESERDSFNKDLQQIHEQKQSNVTHDRNIDMLDIVKKDVHPK